MLKQIQAKLEAKYPGLSKSFLGLIAAQMATKVTEESGIDAAIAELDNAPIPITTLASEFQKEGDRRVTEAKKAFDKTNPKPGSTQTDPIVDPPKVDDNAPEWAKALIEQNKQFATQLQTLQAEKVASATTNKALSILKEKKVPESYYQIGIEGRNFKDEAEAEAYATKMAEAYAQFHQQQVNEGLKMQPAPVQGVVTDPNKEVSPLMKDYIKEKDAQTKKTA